MLGVRLALPARPTPCSTYSSVMITESPKSGLPTQGKRDKEQRHNDINKINSMSRAINLRNEENQQLQDKLARAEEILKLVKEGKTSWFEFKMK